MVRGIGREFMEKTQYKYLEESDQNKGFPQPPLELRAEEGQRIIPLPDPRELSLRGVDLREVIERRRSVRVYSEQPFSLEELSWLLWACQGVKEVVGRPVTLRTVPSAGARHPFETYLLVNRVEGLEPGLYRFLAIDHKLAVVNLKGGIGDRIVEVCLGQRFVETCAVTFIFAAVTYRTYWRYGERGYRYMHLDAGHACQNLYLAAEAIGGGACAIGAFVDEELNKVLDLDGVEQFAIYITTTGKKA
ncbi:MAG: SagB/ThcOx family dehydrogenase [Candidatus Bathyarchaeota archaeon]|nr:MAG: SagB/ThcOx family dehydrogenase [Candidatus Bathyarchaeota archaeon]